MIRIEMSEPHSEAVTKYLAECQRVMNEALDPEALRAMSEEIIVFGFTTIDPRRPGYVARLMSDDPSYMERG